jgi:hypothetical protein
MTSIKTDSEYTAYFIASKLQSAGFKDVQARGVYVVSETINASELGSLMSAAEE